MRTSESRRRSAGTAGGSRAALAQPVGTGVADCRVWLDWAVTQINASLANDAVACDGLLTALDALLRASGGPPGTSSADATIGERMSEVVIAGQSHDRLMQQLAHVAESLRGLCEHLGDPSTAGSGEAWRTLCERQMRAFSMPEERALFSRIVGGGAREHPQLDGACPAGEVDLFEEGPVSEDSST
jgi:hypothetical protein